ncbi:RNA N6-adenosine-methyltransferase mettl16-like [Argiope bruennichi]|uniref:RNA N6-adenosine-methyltransferase mettl16-like n=1 Tax=Argiope bruennichi TaxID=94029 RepID=UPI00249533B9|nr:RNA N6-adenosine-methyltransferase mettl16-like [Argiope bruennichi]
MSFNCFMHERNIYKNRPDFGKIAIDYPEFSTYVIPDKKGKFRIDFNDPNALRMLTRILLKKDFDLNVEIPDGYLIPTVPQRLNYILWIEDLLTVLPKERDTVSGIDIGTGPCAILSLLGSKKNGWHFLSTETADEAMLRAKKNIENNNLESHIKVSKVNKGTVLHDVMIGNEENFDFCVCNPPFFENKDDIRKKTPRMKEKLEIFAKKEEIFAEGGEVSFIKQLLKDSLMLKDRISLYSSMFGKKKSFIEILKELQNVEGVTYTKTEFCQGNTIRWGIAWTFLKDINFEKIQRPKPKKPKKCKPPLVHSITRRLKDGKILPLQKVLEDIKSILHELQISTKIIKSVGNYAELEISANQNTWSHQRRKRREQIKSASHEIDNKTDLRDKSNSCTSVNKSDLNEAKSCLSFQMKEEQGNIQETKSENDFSSTVSLDEQSKNEATNSSESVQKSQKRERSEDEPDVNIGPNMLQNQDNECIPEKDPDIDASPAAKKMKISDPTLSKHKRKSEFDSSPKKKICLTEAPHQVEKNVDQVTAQTNQPDRTFETMPLLYSILKLRITKDNILLAMNCPPEGNRETMHQVFQLFKNKFI